MPNQATAVEWSVLMSAAQQGDRGSYRLLLQQIAPFVRALALRALRDRTEAEDAVQDVLLTLHARRDTYDPQRPFTPMQMRSSDRDGPGAAAGPVDRDVASFEGRPSFSSRFGGTGQGAPAGRPAPRAESRPSFQVERRPLPRRV